MYVNIFLSRFLFVCLCLSVCISVPYPACWFPRGLLSSLSTPTNSGSTNSGRVEGGTVKAYPCHTQRKWSCLLPGSLGCTVAGKSFDTDKGDLGRDVTASLQQWDAWGVFHLNKFSNSFLWAVGKVSLSITELS